MHAPSLREALAPHVASGAVPGLVALLSRRGQVQVEVLGSMALGGPPMARDTIFRISSMTKPITAAAAMLLLEEGALSLDAPVERWLPELAHRRVMRQMEGPLEDTEPAARSITVRDLLTFRHGFGVLMAAPGSLPIQRALEELGLRQGPPEQAVTPGPEEWMRRFATLPLMCQPGEAWLYHTGSELLGVLVARASGRPFADFLQERLFGPLGMVDTGFFVPPEKQARFASAYWTLPEGKGLVPATDPEQWNRPPAFPSGGGGLVSTADDFLAFARMLLNGGLHEGRPILSAASVAAMTTDQLTTAQRATAGIILGHRGWGYGMAVGQGRYGWDGGLGSSWANVPGEGLIGILMTQAAWTSPRQPDVCRAFWNHLQPKGARP